MVNNMNRERIVSVYDFEKNPEKFENVEKIAFYWISGFAIGIKYDNSELLLKFEHEPDITLSNLSISEIYKEPERMFIRLEHKTNILLEGGRVQKLYIRGLPMREDKYILNWTTWKDYVN